MVNGTIKFCNVFDETVNSATINETIPPFGSNLFEEYLNINNYEKTERALNIVWNLKNLSKNSNSSKESSKKQKRESIGPSTTWDKVSYVKVAGSSNSNSDQFELKEGLYIAKTTHTGDGHCGIWLLHGNGKRANLIANETGYIIESKAVRIDEAGYYLIDVSADGEWTVTMDYQEPKSIEKEDFQRMAKRISSRICSTKRS